MIKVINADLAAKILLGGFGLVLLVHVLIIARVVPASIVWGGQIKTDNSNLIQMEILAIALTVLFASIVIFKLRSLHGDNPSVLIKISMWIACAYLVLNFLGNFASGVKAETFIFGPLTIVMALCALRLAVE